jgi:fumarylacetoacetase
LRNPALDVPSDHPFGLRNLPFGAFLRDGRPHVGVAIGDFIFDLHVAAQARLLDDLGTEVAAACQARRLNALAGCGRSAWRALRARVTELLSANDRTLANAGISDRAFVRRSVARMVMPLDVGDYVDFYSSLEHATNMGKLLRPDADALTPNWRWLPIGYHGRAGSLVVSGTPITRPRGQYLAANSRVPTFDLTRKLDFELELAFVTGAGPTLGTPITPDQAEEYIFGVALLNDWSARDIQAWEYQPLGPFLGKSFATSIAPWILALDALEPFRVAGPLQEPQTLPYLATKGAHNFAVDLEVLIATERMRDEGTPPHVLSRTTFAAMYWSMAQQLAHASSNGSRVRPGDIFASGTISGSEPGTYGSMAEATAMGRAPILLPNGQTRAFLEDGDTVTMHGQCTRGSDAPIELGSVTGTIC